MADWNTIATAAKAVLDALADFPDTTVRKEHAVHPRDSIASPLCVISFGQEALQPGVVTFGDATSQPTISKVYGLVFTIYTVTLGDIESGLTTFPGYVLAAKQALHKGTLTGASTVWNTDLIDNPAWEDVKIRDGVQMSEFGINFYSAEARNG